MMIERQIKSLEKLAGRQLIAAAGAAGIHLLSILARRRSDLPWYTLAPDLAFLVAANFAFIAKSPVHLDMIDSAEGRIAILAGKKTFTNMALGALAVGVVGLFFT